MTGIIIKIATPAIAPNTIPIIDPVDRSSSSESLGNTVMLEVAVGDANEMVGVVVDSNEMVGGGVANTLDMSSITATAKKLASTLS